MKVGDLVKPRNNWHSRWYGHLQAAKMVGLIVGVDIVDRKNPHYNVLWSGNVFEPAAAGSGLEVLND